MGGPIHQISLICRLSLDRSGGPAIGHRGTNEARQTYVSETMIRHVDRNHQIRHAVRRPTAQPLAGDS